MNNVKHMRCGDADCEGEPNCPCRTRGEVRDMAPVYCEALEQIRAIIESDSELPYRQVNQINKIVCEALEEVC